MVALALSGQALAADLPMKAKVAAPAAPDFDIAFGGGIVSDYIFRGITQSNHGPSAHGILRAALQRILYRHRRHGHRLAGGCRLLSLNSPSAEVDLYGGWRPVVGKWSFDFGYIYYLYPKSIPAAVELRLHQRFRRVLCQGDLRIHRCFLGRRRDLLFAGSLELRQEPASTTRSTRSTCSRATFREGLGCVYLGCVWPLQCRQGTDVPLAQPQALRDFSIPSYDDLECGLALYLQGLHA